MTTITSTMLTGGQAVAATLAANGVSVIFGLPGMHNLPIYDALLDQPTIRSIVCRNEQGAALMANAAGRATGQPGVCLVTTGPAACNALAGVADAARESVPMLVIASQIRSDLQGQGRGAFHEMADQMGMFRAAGAWAGRANTVEQIPAVLNAAWVAAAHGRPGPAYVEIPQDVLFARGHAQPHAAPLLARPSAGAAQLAGLLERLSLAQRPLVYVGAGAARSGASAPLLELVERLGLPTISSIGGKGVLPEDHPLSAGCLPMSEPACVELLRRCDVLLALGTGFSEVTTAGWTLPFPRELIHVDIDAAQIGRSVPASLGIAGNVRTVLEALNANLAGRTPAPRSGWAQEVIDLRLRLEHSVEGMVGAAINRSLRAALPRDGLLVGDAASWGGWQIWHFPVFGASQMLYPIHFGTLGYALPGALGAQAACPGRRVVAVCGDGGFLFCAQELSTARQYGLPIVALVVNNGGFQTIRQLQTQLYGAERVTGADLCNPDLVSYGHSFGCHADRIHSPAELEPALARAFASQLPAILELAFEVAPAPANYAL